MTDEPEMISCSHWGMFPVLVQDRPGYFRDEHHWQFYVKYLAPEPEHP